MLNSDVQLKLNLLDFYFIQRSSCDFYVNIYIFLCVCVLQRRATTGHGDLSAAAPMPKHKAAHGLPQKI